MKSITAKRLAKSGIKIKSVNNFATAAGLASSSSGLSCLAVCLAKVYDLKEEFEGQLSDIINSHSSNINDGIQEMAEEVGDLKAELSDKTL